MGFPVVLLTTRGAKTNQERTTPLGGFKAHSRVLSPGFALFHPGLPVEIVAKDTLAVAWRRFDHDAYRGRSVIQRAVNGFKHWRGLATRYDKHAVVYRGGLVLAAALIWLATEVVSSPACSVSCRR